MTDQVGRGQSVSPAWLQKLEQASGRSLDQQDQIAHERTEHLPLAHGGLSPQAAAVGIILGVFNCKDGITDEKVQYLTILSNHHRIFRSETPEEFETTLARMVEMSSELGADSLIEECAANLPRALKPTVFALVLDIVFVVEGYLDTEYRTIIERIQEALEIPEVVANPIGNVLAIKAALFDPGEGAEF